MARTETQEQVNSISESDLIALQSTDISAIEKALKGLGAFGEIHLVVEKGRIRFIRTVRSEALGHDASSKDVGKS